jgi:hypothetical protein
MPISISGNGSITGVPGSILQVVQSEFTQEFQTDSTSYVPTGHIATITPTSNTSKILVDVSGGGGYTRANVVGGCNKIYRQIGSGSYSGITSTTDDWVMYTASGGAFIGPHAFKYLDSPATTSVVNYQTYIRRHPNGTNNYYDYNVSFYGVDIPTVTMTLMEISA